MILRIPFDSLTLRCVSFELKQLLEGGQIQDIRQPSQMETVLGIRSHGGSYLLLLSADPERARVHLTNLRPPNAPTPPSFCMALRKYMEGRRILNIRQAGFDRIFEIQAGGTEEGDYVTLTAELMGKHSNLILINSAGKVIDSARRVTHRINRVREILPGIAYQPPPVQPDRLDPFQEGSFDKAVCWLTDSCEATGKELEESLAQSFAGFSPFLSREIAARTDEAGGGEAGLREAWREIIQAAGQNLFQPTLVYDGEKTPAGAYPYPVFQYGAVDQEPVGSVNAALDLASGKQGELARLKEVSADLARRIEKALKRHEMILHSALRSLEEGSKAEQYRQLGDLIIANIWNIRPGDTETLVADYFEADMPERVIPLDPQLSAHENAEHWFNRYRKAQAGIEHETVRLKSSENAIMLLKSAKTAMASRNGEELLHLKEELQANGLLNKLTSESDSKGSQKEQDFAGHKIRRFHTPEGFEVLAGETATANDFLTTRIAAPNDIWLHVRAGASSHVIIRTHGKPERVPRSVLEAAARICARYSKQKHAALVPVDYTLKRYVRKPRGSAAGAVDYRNESSLELDMMKD